MRAFVEEDILFIAEPDVGPCVAVFLNRICYVQGDDDRTTIHLTTGGQVEVEASVLEVTDALRGVERDDMEEFEDE